MHALRTAFVAALAAAAAGCASTFVASWRNPEAAPLDVTGAKVAAIVMLEDEASRRIAEDELASELNARGADGVPMYSVLPDTEPSGEAAVREALEAQGFEGVVVMRPVETTRETVYSPSLYRQPYYGGFWGGYYMYGWGMPWPFVVYGPTEVRTDTIVSVETLVYSLRQNKLVWAGQSENANPPDVGRLIHETARRAARELERLGLLPG